MPGSVAARIATLDVIRGVAVMGILLMNIVAFGLPEAAYSNPHALLMRGRFDDLVWLVNFVLVDGKMRGLFSFLFGASMLLVADRAAAKGESAARVHYARMGWLFVIGMVHLYAVWSGDILHHYALVGALAFGCRDMPPARLVALAIVLIGAETLLTVGLPLDIAQTAAAVRHGHPGADVLRHWAELRQSFGPLDRAMLASDLAANRGSYADVFAYRLPDAESLPLQTFTFLGPETFAYMLLGMAGLRTGMLAGAWPRATYRRWAAIGFGVGVPAYAALAWLAWAHGFDPFWVALCVVTLSGPVRPVMIVGWASLIVLLARPDGWLTRRIAAAGRMAFTNYLATSLICTTLFYGYGAGLYGRLSRAELYVVVAAVWLLILLWSAPWLARFRYGPLEWMWRSLARWQRQPLRGAA